MKSTDLSRGKIRAQMRNSAMPARKVSADLHSKTLNDAIHSIYSVYGSNLAAFFRDVEDAVTHGESRIKLNSRLIQSAKRDRYRGARR